MTFWIVTIGLAALVAVLLGLALMRPRGRGEPAAAYDLQVYRDQLKEVDRDLARGVIAAADAERIRAEISRRILTADAQAQAETAGRGQPALATLILSALIGAALLLGSVLLYRDIGAPGYGDLALADRIDLAEEARSTRPAQLVAENSLPPRPALQLSEDYIALVAQLRETVAKRPNDLQGQLLLAQNEANIDNFVAAYQAQEQVVQLKGDAADAGDLADLADMMILASGGYVSPEAEAVLRAALEQDASNGAARYYWGLMMGQTGRPDVAFQIWDTLLRQSAPGDAWVAPIRAQIEDMASRAGANYLLPAEATPLSGPSAEDVEAASDMSAEDRMEMIRGMVGGLSERLASEGGPPQDWARLISSLGVLGDQAQAISVYNNALEVFDGNAMALDVIRSGARQAGLIP